MATYKQGLLVGVVLGVGITTVCMLFTRLKSQPKAESGWKAISFEDGDDDCYSLFYSHVELGESNFRMPLRKTCPELIERRMRTIQKEYKYLPGEIYGSAVQNLPLVCVDVLCRRKSDGKLLLFYRRDKPACDMWWWPGGRMFRGETFYEAAERKVADETGNPISLIKAKAVVHVWNTFFPDSNWDASRQKGYEGSQTVNVVVLCDFEGDDLHLDEKAKNQWAVQDHRWITRDEAVAPGVFDKYISLNVAAAVKSGLL